MVRHFRYTCNKIEMFTQRKYHQPPRLSEWLLNLLFPGKNVHHLAGDIAETFQIQVREQGMFRARWWYRGQLFKALPPLIHDIFRWRFIMFINYLKTAVRNLFKRKGYSLINIAGLAIGIATCLLILMFVNDELSYDSFNNKADRIYRVAAAFMQGGKNFNVAVIAPPVAQALIDECPEVENAVRFRQRGRFIFQHKDNIFKETKVSYVDPSFFDIFSIPLLRGDPADALKQPNTLILSQKTAKKYFSDEDPVGRILRLNDQTDFIVTGVFRDIPDNSHFHFDVLISMTSLAESKSKMWLNQNFQTYILLQTKADPVSVEARFPDMIKKYMGSQIEVFMGKSIEQLAEENEFSAKFFLQPLRDIHLHSDLIAEMEPTSNVRYIYIFFSIAIFILIIAAINYINLSTSLSAGRATEVGIRKVLGSFRSQLIRQFLTESVLLSIVSLFLSLGLLSFALPFFNKLSGKNLSMSALGNLYMLTAIGIITIFIGLVAGCYSSFFLSTFKPINILKGKIRSGIKSGWLRRGLVVFQFAASIILITATFVVHNQLHYIQNKKLGYEKDQVIILTNTNLLGDQAEAFKNKMLGYPQIISATISGFLPVPSNRYTSTVLPEGDIDSNLATSMENWIVDYDYIQTMGMKVVSGRDFSRDYSTDNKAAIINQSAAKQFGWENPVGRRIGRISSDIKNVELYEVIGIVEDFHFESLKETIGPLVMFLGSSTDMISFRIDTQNIAGTIDLLRNVWKEFLPQQPIEYNFLDEQFSNIYQTEQRIGKIFGVFSGLAIFIGCLGLYALAAFTAERRTKEIGIRKILGASTSNIIRMLTKEFVILIASANIIAWPVAFWVMRGWLNDFSYRIPLNIWMFFSAGFLTLSIALLTVSFQAVKVALTNPSTSLRYE